jgi:hypothetical protein
MLQEAFTSCAARKSGTRLGLIDADVADDVRRMDY